MSMERLPPYPSSGNLATWARQITEYLIDAQSTEKGGTKAAPVALQHKITDERAFQSGILMYDPLRQSVVVSENNLWRPLNMDPAYHQAENVVLAYNGDVVSVEAKKKNLNKFGLNVSVGTTFETVGEFQGAVANETFATTNSIDSVVSNNVGNNGTTFVLEGLPIDGSGNLTFVEQEVTLATPATNPTTLDIPLARAVRMYPKNTTTFGSPEPDVVGNIYVYDATLATGVTAGVPNVASATKLLLNGENQSQKCATSTSSEDYWFIHSLDAGIGTAGGNASRVQVRLEARELALGGVWRPVGRDIILAVGQTGVQVDYSPLTIIPKNCDVRVRARTDANTASVFAELRGVLASVQTT